MRLLVVTPRELTRDGRARRQVEAAIAAGYEVAGLSAVLRGDTPSPLDDVAITRVAVDRVSGPLRRLGLGGYRPSRAPVRELRGLWRLLRLAKTTLALARSGRRLGRFDLVHANDLDALAAAYLVARRSKARLVYDAHELYRLMEPDPPRAYWAIASRIERFVARRATVVTNCELFATEIERMLGLSSRPIVVMNAPDRDDDVDADTNGRPLRAIYQASLDHPGRPVSDVLDAAERAPGVEFAIRLLHFDEDRLRAEIERRGLSDRVVVTPPVDPNDVVRGLRGFDVGLVINRPLTLNDELAVPGKIFEYMMGGLAVVAPRLAGIAELLEHEDVGVMYDAGDARALGDALAALSNDPERVAALRRRARSAALERYNAQHQATTLAALWAGRATA
jgi:glycosyltransferase involved in cell wall biosynthesis